MPGSSINEVFEANRDRIMALPGVVGAGIGESGGAPCIRVFIEVPAAEVAGLPLELEGYRVEIDETGPFDALGPGA